MSNPLFDQFFLLVLPFVEIALERCNHNWSKLIPYDNADSDTIDDIPVFSKTTIEQNQALFKICWPAVEEIVNQPLSDLIRALFPQYAVSDDQKWVVLERLTKELADHRSLCPQPLEQSLRTSHRDRDLIPSIRGASAM